MQRIIDKNILGMYVLFFITPQSNQYFFNKSVLTMEKKRATSNLKPTHTYWLTHLVLDYVHSKGFRGVCPPPNLMEV